AVGGEGGGGCALPAGAPPGSGRAPPPGGGGGVGGGGVPSTNLVVCPLPVPPRKRGRGTHRVRREGEEGHRVRDKVRQRTQRRLARCYGRDQRGRDPC